MKRVVVNGYTYETEIDNLRVGDAVVLPTPYWLRDVKGPTWVGNVEALTSSYSGDCARIVGRAA
jgi:hypothetical protein